MKFTRIIILLLSFTYLYSQPVQITGYIQDAQTGEPLIGANILVEGMSLGASSDDSGYFNLTLPKKGAFILTASYLGYTPAKKRLDISDKPLKGIIFDLRPEILDGQTIVISGTRAKERETPVTFSNVTRAEIEDNYTASDIPMMLSELPNTFSYSLTGDALGYSFIKIRGFDQKRIGVMINDIPLNDPEDHQVYWVDMPDLAESIQDIQVQRGVGSSVYGSSTFGGSININTSQFTGERSISAQYGYGSYNTRKFSAEYKSGIVAETYSFYGRFSKITSDGFRDNSASDLWAYFIGAARYDENMVTKINIYGGPERTHPDWDGVPEDILKDDRKYKASAYTNDVDEFNQPHYEISNEWRLSEKLEWKNIAYYIRGEGYYENYKVNKDLSDFGMTPYLTADPALFGADSLDYYESDSGKLVRDEGYYTVNSTDLVRQKWVQKNQYGLISKTDWKLDSGDLTMGVSGYTFDSHHFGKVIWAKNIPSEYDPDRKYYEYTGDRINLSAFYNYLYHYSPKIYIMSNLLYEYKSQDFEQQPTALFQGDQINAYSLDYHFLSPRIGVTYLINDKIHLYGNVSYSQREPSDDDLYDAFAGPDDLGVAPLFAKSDTIRVNGNVTKVEWDDPYIDPEELLDYEFGIGYRSSILSAAINIYWMDFRNEIIPLGGVDKDGFPIKGNAESTIHRGIELSANAALGKYFALGGNFAFSQNYFGNFTQNEYDWETGETTPVDFKDKTIAGFPDLIGNIKISANIRKFTSSLSLQHVGKQFLDNTENESRRIDPFTTANAMFSYRFPKSSRFPGFRLTFKINNLLDEEYETAGYYDSWSDVNYYYPAAGRNYYTAIQVEL